MKDIALLGNKISLHKANVLSFIHQEIGHLNSTLIVTSLVPGSLFWVQGQT